MKLKKVKKSGVSLVINQMSECAGMDSGLFFEK